MKTFTIVLFLFLYTFSFAQPNPLIDGAIVGFDLSPDEQTIVFACPNWERPRPSFAVVDVRSGKIRKLIENGESISFPKFSSDGKRILFEDRYNTLKSIDLKGDDIQTHFKFEITLSIDSLCYSPDGSKIYFAADSLNEIPQKCRMYQLDIKNGEVSVVPGILSQYIHGLAVSGRDILFSTSEKDGVKEAKIFRLKPEQGNTVEVIVPEGNPRVFALLNYHKATNQLIFVNKSGLYKMDMATKKLNVFTN